MSGTRRFAIALGTGVALMTALGVAVALSYYPVRPRILCAMPLGTGGHAVYFGYVNERDEVVVEPRGPDNRLTPRGSSPAEFAPGSSGNFPDAAFVVQAKPDEEIAWTLGPRTVRFDDETPRCPVPTMPLPPPEEVVWIPPKPEPLELPPPPPVIEIPEPPPKEEPPPEVAEDKPPPKRAPPKRQPKAETMELVEALAFEDEPVALEIQGLTTLDSGMAVAGGTIDAFGDPGARSTGFGGSTKVGDLEGAIDGIAGGERSPPKRVAARVKVRPKGEWPADAPPRAGSVLVRLSLRVGTDGRVKQVKVIRGAGPAFNREARAVGFRAVFEPATVGGEPIESWVPWDVEFTPDEW